MGKINRLLICMSTLPHGASQRYYMNEKLSYENGKNYVFYGISQLEAGTKSLITKLSNDGEVLDKVVIIGTKETIDEKVKVDDGEYTAREFYEKRINEFIRHGDISKIETYRKEVQGDVDELDDIIMEEVGYLSGIADIESINDISLKNIYSKFSNRHKTQEDAFTKLNIDKSDYKLLFDMLDESSKETIDVSKYAGLYEKYRIADGQVIADNLRKTKLLYAAYARLKYEYEMKKDFEFQIKLQAGEVIQRLTDMIQKLSDQIESLSHEKENKYISYIKAKVIQVLAPYSVNVSELYTGKNITMQDIIANDDEDIYKAIPEACEGMVSDITNLNDLNMYMDMQGGYRNNMFVINSVVQLLRIRGIEVVATSSVHFEYRNNIDKIVDVTFQQRIVSLVSGMNDVVNFGSAYGLMDYYREYKVNKGDGRKTIPEENIINAMKTISEDISVCDVISFGDDLIKLSAAIDRYCSNKELKKDPIFDYFVNDLRRDYSDELLNHPDDLCRQIEWCYRKRLYQQALTLIESKLPEYMDRKKICYYAKNEGERRELLKKFLREYIKCLNSGKEKLLFTFRDVEHYMFTYFAKNFQSEYTEYHSDDNIYGQIDVIYKDVKNLRNNVNHAGDEVKNGFAQADMLIGKIIELIKGSYNIQDNLFTLSYADIDKTYGIYRKLFEIDNARMGDYNDEYANRAFDIYDACYNIISSEKVAAVIKDCGDIEDEDGYVNFLKQKYPKLCDAYDMLFGMYTCGIATITDRRSLKGSNKGKAAGEILLYDFIKTYKNVSQNKKNMPVNRKVVADTIKENKEHKIMGGGSLAYNPFANLIDKV